MKRNKRKIPPGNQIKREKEDEKKFHWQLNQGRRETSRLNGKALKTVMKLIEACDNIMRSY